MKKITVVLAILSLLLASLLVLAQAPAPGARGGGQRGPQVPPATGPMLDLANKIADAINKHDADALTKMIAPDAVYLDEDGHAPPIARWVTQLTAPGKKIEISSTHGQLLDNAGWVSFNYVVGETFQGNPKNLKGTASIVAKKGPGGDWMIQLVHGALYQKVAGLPEGD